jgi:hypothetical protein
VVDLDLLTRSSGFDDQPPMPRQDGVRGNDRGHFLEVLPAHRVALCSQPTALIVRQEQSPSTTLLLQDLVRLDQVLDHPLLVPSDPALNGQEEAPERLESERNPGIVADLRSLL